MWLSLPPFAVNPLRLVWSPNNSHRPSPPENDVSIQTVLLTLMSRGQYAERKPFLLQFLTFHPFPRPLWLIFTPSTSRPFHSRGESPILAETTQFYCASSWISFPLLHRVKPQTLPDIFISSILPTASYPLLLDQPNK